MKATSRLQPCCSESLTRRAFIKETAGVAVGIAGGAVSLAAASKERSVKSGKPETLVSSFYETLTDEQRRAIVHPFDHPLRSKIDNNWHINDKTIADFYTKEQQELVRQIFIGLHSPEYAKKVMQQVEHDNSGDGGFGGCAVALFGQPGSGKFEFVFTGRHVTRRCDGDSVEGAAFGGPIFYGHAAKGFNEKPDHPGNIYWYQAVRANEVFKALDGKQRELALLGDPRAEKGTDTVKLEGRGRDLPGVPISTLSRDQKELVRKVMGDVLAPFRKADADEALKLVDTKSFEGLYMSFYKNLDVGDDGVWDVWQIEGPSMIWYFRGHPHVHTWVHIRENAKQA